MKLEMTLTEKDVDRIILEWANCKYPGMFNKVRIGSSYSLNFVELSFEKPVEPAPTPPGERPADDEPL